MSMVTLPREVVESLQKRLTAALDEPRETMSDAKALREIVRQLRLMRDALSTALAAGEARPEPVAVITECEACFTPDVCQLRGTCDHYSAEWLRIAAPPPPAVEARAVAIGYVRADGTLCAGCPPISEPDGWRPLYTVAPQPAEPVVSAATEIGKLK